AVVEDETLRCRSSGRLDRADRKRHQDSRSLLSRFDSHAATELARSFAHSGDPDTGGGEDRILIAQMSRHSATFILDREMETIGLPFQANSSNRTFRVPLDVRQRFLNDSKHGRFHLAWKPVELLGKIERH